MRTRARFDAMRLVLFPLAALCLFAFAPISHAQTRANPARPSASKVPVLASEAEWKTVFSYFPMPYVEPAHVDYRYVLNQLPAPQGLFRLTIDPQGTVTEIKILQHMGGV